MLDLDWVSKIGVSNPFGGGDLKCTANFKCGLECEMSAQIGPIEYSTEGGFESHGDWITDWDDIFYAFRRHLPLTNAVGGKLAVRSCRRFQF